MTDPDNTPKRRWLKFRLRTLLIFVAVTAAALGKQLHGVRPERQIEGQLAKLGLTRPAQVHIAKDPADVAILDHIEHHDVELLVMGTVARAGIPGLLLPQIPCSVLAVKPDGFTSPVTLERSEAT